MWGLHQSSKLWWSKFTGFLCSIGFKQHKEVGSLLTYEPNGKVLANFGYFIDDCIISAVNEATANLIVKKICSTFESVVSEKDANGCIDMLGINIKEVRHNGVQERLELNQADYITKLGDKVGIHRV
ncbi:unnamed protein product [Ambrosiozyma monospora]|uniref:Unnamed protein product n=1 Tax=Ambrosiozyma monospora TaxID=43982 RepID=A0ACB5U588_AMBMO|nr:unnamed protein product [Ambrosiozyma monospora]